MYKIRMYFVTPEPKISMLSHQVLRTYVTEPVKTGLICTSNVMTLKSLWVSYRSTNLTQEIPSIVL